MLRLIHIKPFSLLRIALATVVATVALVPNAAVFAAGSHEDGAAFQRNSRAAAAGSIEAMYELGNMYVFGIGVPQSEADPDQRAAQFYFEAARRGHAGAQHALGILYLTGKGVLKDENEAQKWFRRAAEQGHTPSRAFLVPPR